MLRKSRLHTKTVAFSFLLSVVGNGAALAQSGRAEPVADCPQVALDKLGQAKDYLIAIRGTLANDFEIDARDGQERRTERQIRRRLEKLRFKCKPDPNCNTSTAFHTITGGNAVRFCWNAMTRGNWTFCRMVDTVAHEFGHIAHLPRDRVGLHNAQGEDDPDRVYQFGHFAADVCEMDRDPTATVNTAAAPSVITTPMSSVGVTLYPHSNYRGRWRQFFPGGARDTSVRGFTFWDDLRFIGRNNAFSSARIHSGDWELCDRARSLGRCIYLSNDTPDFRDLRFDNATTSIRQINISWPPTDGIFLFADKDYLGGGKYFARGDSLHLEQYRLEGAVSSYKVVGGVWEGCEGVLYRGWCHSLSGEKSDLSLFGIDNKIKSLAPVEPRRDGLLLYKDKRFRGAHKFLSAAEYLNFGLHTPNIDNEARSLIVVGGEWEVCSDPGMRGTCERVTGAVADLETIGLDLKISSAKKIAATASSVELYRDANFEGGMLRLSNARADLTGDTFDNAVSSVKVLDGRTWEMCDLPDYRGWCYRFRGWHASLGHAGIRLNDRISSLRPLTDSETSARGLILFEHGGRLGASRRFTESVSNLSSLAINNQASSAWVQAGRWQICRGSGYSNCTEIAGAVDSLTPLGLNDAVSSVRRLD